jgi:hypothetical protein
MTLVFVMKGLKIIPILRLIYSDLIYDLLTILTRSVGPADHVAHLRTGKNIKF